MDEIIEQDALLDPASQDPPPPDTHTHEVKSFVATPRAMDQTLIEKALAWIKGEYDPNAPIVLKSADGMRRMFLITSNSYKDRDGETITSDALKEYEASCYPGEDLYHNDNPLLYWHDDEIVIGEIIGVEYIEPFLVEVAKEIDDPIAKIIWDFAEKNGDKAGTSHRFGYLEKDRDEDGTFHRIFKQETSYLPERSLAANDRTYAGVIAPMSIPESRKRLASILSEATQVEDWADLIREEGIPAVKKRLLSLGVQNKALPPKAVAPKPAAVEGEEVIEEEDVEEDLAETPDMDIASFSSIVNTIAGLVMDLVDAQSGVLDTQMGMAKAHEDVVKELTELKEMRVSEKAADSTTIKGLQDQLKALGEEVAALKQRASLAPRAAARTIGETDPAMAKMQIADAIDTAGEARKQQDKKFDPFWGELTELPK
jgi:hypothetical protein